MEMARRQRWVMMYTDNTSEEVFKQRVAANLAYYRKLNNTTQAELAERINYSDKSVSKWECASGVPDIYVLALLADLYGVSVDDFFRENAPSNPPPVSRTNKYRIMVLLLSIGVAWLSATVIFTVLRLFAPAFEQAWLVFILAMLASCIVAVVFTSLWWKMTVRFLATSALVWSVALFVFLTIPLHNIYLIFPVGAVMQILVVLWYLMQKQAGRR
jgi:transcriptional regulator with XRE-family HTH domain